MSKLLRSCVGTSERTETGSGRHREPPPTRALPIAHLSEPPVALRSTPMPTAEEITRHFDDDPDGAEWVGADPPAGPIEVVESDPAWPAQFELFAARIREALGDRAL